MLKLRNDFIGLALVATLFVGCQTAQKTNDLSYGVTEDDLYNSYYVGSNDSVDRNPAGIETPIEEMWKALRGISVKAFGRAADTNAEHAFLRYVNRSGLEDVTRLKNEKFAAAEDAWIKAGKKGERPVKGKADVLEEKDLKKLYEMDPGLQAKIAKNFMDEQGLKDLPGLSKIYSKVEAQVDALANADAKANKLTGAQKTVLLTDQEGRAKNINGKIASNVDEAKLRAQVQELIKKMSTNDPKFAQESARAEQLLRDGRLLNARNYRWTNGTLNHFTVNTCDNLTLDALERYVELLRDIDNKFKEIAKSKGLDTEVARALPCRNMSELTAWVAAKFQERLGRSGIAAYTAVQEMSICHFLDARTSEGAERMAAANHGVVVDEVKCN